MMSQSLLHSTFCTCTTNLQPTHGGGYTMHLSCSLSGNSSLISQTCLGTYNFTRVSTYEASVWAGKIRSVSFTIDLNDRRAHKASVSLTLGFTTAVPIPSGGALTLNYPSGFFAKNVIPVIDQGASSVDELMAWCGETTSSSLIITTHGATISTPMFTVTIQGLTMGSATTGADISLQTSSDNDASAPVASGEIFGQILNVSFDIPWYHRIAGKPSVPVTLSFTPSSPIPSGGTITLTYPRFCFDLSSQPLVVLGMHNYTDLMFDFKIVRFTASFIVMASFGATINASPFSLVIKGMTIGASAASRPGITVRTSIDKLTSVSISSGVIWSPGNMSVTWSPQDTKYSRDSLGNVMIASARIWDVDLLQYSCVFSSRAVFANSMIILFLKTKLSMLKSAMPNLAFRRMS
jgi:hypothetical protein